MKLVKCKLCEKYFDREKEPFVRIGARYAHKACQESGIIKNWYKNLLKSVVIVLNSKTDKRTLNK